MKKAKKKAAKAKAAKKKAAKKAVAKKATAKKAPAKKASGKKAKAAPVKKKAAKKAPVVKRAAKKAATKVAKKAVKKATKKAAKKAAKKVVAKVAKKQPPRKAAAPKKVKAPAAAPTAETPIAELPPEVIATPTAATETIAAETTTIETVTTAPPTPATPTSPDEVLIALAQRLLDDAQYVDEVRLAVTAPEEYATTYAEELKLSGVDGTPPNLPWIALTDGLRQRDALVMLDEKFEPDDLTYALDTLLAKRSEQVDLTGLPGYDDSTAALEMVGDRLLAAGLALVTVDNHDGKETFPVAILPADQVEEAQRLASTLGLGLIRRWSSEEVMA